MTMAVMNITHMWVLVLDRCVLMLMGMPIGLLRIACELVIPRVVVAVVGISSSSRRIVPVAVGMA